MCGIAGVYYFDKDRPVAEATLAAMTDALAHRGPDDRGVLLDGAVGLGHRRLSIIDTSAAGHQPMPNEDGTVWIAYNGEFYSYREVKKNAVSGNHTFRSQTDTEVILHLYEELGPAVAQKLDGIFAFAIWDRPLRRLLLVRDHLGVKPLYYYLDENHLSFASEAKALLHDPELRPEVELQGLYRYLHFMSIPGPASIFKGVKQLPPGHYLLVENGKAELVRYWNLPGEARGDAAGEDLPGQLRERLRQAVRSQLVSDVPLGAFLSGGLDSGSVVTLAAPESAEKFKTYTITFPGLGGHDEAEYARLVAAASGTAHREIPARPDLVPLLERLAWHADEPFAVSSGLGILLLAQAAREQVKVVLSGDGGDELLAGYPARHRRWSLARRGAFAVYRTLRELLRQPGFGPAWNRFRQELSDLTAAPAENCFRDLCVFSGGEISELLRPEIDRALLGSVREEMVSTYLELPAGADDLMRKLYVEIKTTLVSEMLTKVDRLTMAVGLEARVPFLDRRLVEWAFPLPYATKISGNNGKLLLKAAMRELLPPPLLAKKKQGFNFPLGLWLRGELREFVCDILSERTVRERGWFVPEKVAALLAAHFAGRADFSNRIFILVMLELWQRKFLDRAAASRLAG